MTECLPSRRSSCASLMWLVSSESSVERGQAVGHALEVVHLFRVRTAREPDTPALVRGLDERSQLVRKRLLRGADDRHLDAECLLRAPHGLVMEERDDGLAEGQRL